MLECWVWREGDVSCGGLKNEMELLVWEFL